MSKNIRQYLVLVIIFLFGAWLYNQGLTLITTEKINDGVPLVSFGILIEIGAGVAFLYKMWND
jgi:hypothetical protein